MLFNTLTDTFTVNQNFSQRYKKIYFVLFKK